MAHLQYSVRIFTASLTVTGKLTIVARLRSVDPDKTHMFAVGKPQSIAVYRLAYIKEPALGSRARLERDMFRRKIRGKSRENKNYTYELFWKVLNRIGLVVYLFF